MPIRNPFRRAGAPEALDDTQRTASERGTPGQPGTKPLQVKDPAEYKLSEINDSGVYLPPSPTHEKPSFWHTKSSTSIASSNHRSLLSENEPFNISRESFDSYRRSFDISARSPIPESLDGMPRPSLDARRSMDTRRSLDVRGSSLDVRRSRAPPRSSMQETRPRPEFASEATAEEGFEDVGLQDEPKPVKKRGLFARFGDNNDADLPKEERPASSHHFGFTGRKRAQSKGEGSEMKSMPKPSGTPQQTPEISVEAR